MKRKLFFPIIMLFASMIVFSSCTKDEDTEETPDNTLTEYIADNNSFANFRSFTKVAENNGPDPALGMAHSGNDSTVTRYIYFKDDASVSNGQYPIGTIIVKESKNTSGSVAEVTAMVKRGNNFDSGGNNWEYFMLETDGKIAMDGSGMAMRGASLMGGMCNSCHSNAAIDYIFSK